MPYFVPICASLAIALTITGAGARAEDEATPTTGEGSSPHGAASPDKLESAPPANIPANIPPKAALNGAWPRAEGELRKNLDFWIHIYTQYSTSQGVVHDGRYVDRIYEIVDVSGLSHADSIKKVRTARLKWEAILLSVHHKKEHPETMDADEFRVFKMYEDISDPDKYQAAANHKRLRFQLGQRENFLSGLFESGRYLSTMEDIFRREGLPVELTRLPFVESSFNTHARSKVGASGVWQFMRSTGKVFMKINDTVDERNDPILATEAAAKLLRQNFESLGSWPLAVTAYNHGRQGMMRAVRRLGSDDLEELVFAYHSRSFGFASSNYFIELLAAIEVEKNSEKYFGKVPRALPLSSFEVPLPNAIQMKHLCRFLSLDPKKMRDLNPALSEVVLKGSRPIPQGYPIRMALDPSSKKDSEIKMFLAGFEQIPATYRIGAKRVVKAKRKASPNA